LIELAGQLVRGVEKMENRLSPFTPSVWRGDSLFDNKGDFLENGMCPSLSI